MGGSRLEFTLWLFSTYAIIGLSVAIVVYAVLVALKRTEQKRKFE